MRLNSYTDVDFSTLLGKTLIEIVVTGDDIKFVTNDGVAFLMHHTQDCCEYVTIESIVGDTADLLNAPITLAEESSNQDNTEYGESETWTFYKLATNKGYVDIRWHGSSNGYYSESVDFVMLK